MASSLRERLHQIVGIVFGRNPYRAAQTANIQPSVLHRLLNRETAEPRLGTVRRLADAYGVPLEWLLGETASDEARQRNVPEWFWLLVAFNRRRQRPARDWLANAEAKSSESRRLISAYREFHLLDFPDESSLPASEDLFGGKTASHSGAALELLRMLGDAETELLALVIKRLKEMGVTSH